MVLVPIAIFAVLLVVANRRASHIEREQPRAAGSREAPAPRPVGRRGPPPGSGRAPVPHPAARVDPATADRLLRPRGRHRRRGGRGRRATSGWTHGPFDHYERHVVTERSRPAAADGDGAGAVLVTQTVDFRLPAGTWPFLLNPAVRYTLKRPARAASCPGGTRPSGPTPAAPACWACWPPCRSSPATWARC